MKNIICTLTMLTALIATAKESYKWTVEAPINKWDEAIPLGNGLTGCLVWGEKNKLRFSFDRGDLWDNRKPKEILEEGFTYANLQKLIKDKNTKEIARLTDKPYSSPYPTKLPGVRLELELTKDFHANSFNLDMKSAVATVQSTNGKAVNIFTNAVHPVTLIRCPGYKKASLKVPTSVKRLGYEDPKSGQDGTNLWWQQSTLEKLKYGAYVAVKKLENETLLAVAFTSTKDDKAFMELAKKRATAALELGYQSLLTEHKNWWSSFWSTSEINIPDLKHERYYHLMQYYYGSASRKGAPPMPLQGVWTADAGGLPPWKGDYHHDMNTQMIYWAYYTSGRYECGESLLDFQFNLEDVHRKFAKDFYGVDGILVPGVMGFDGQPLTGWAQYSLSPTMSLWLLQNYHWHWRYTMDKKMLKDKIYPYCRETVLAIEGLLKPDKNGKLKLPLSTSPEVHNNSLKAWLTPNTNNDLSKLHWMCDIMVEMATELGLENDIKHWQNLKPKFEPLAVNKDNILRLSPDEDLKSSHRHHSHLMAIYPLSTLNIEQGEHEKKVVLASLDNLNKMKFNAWVGFSFSWAACLEARAKRADQSFDYLDRFVSDFTSRNGFNLNGQQREGKGWVSGFRYRPFTLDANFGASQTIHEMLLQSWGNRVRIFPAVPSLWKDLSFKKLRAEGGFMVSAELKKGEVHNIKITATVDSILRLENKYHGKIRWNRPLKIDGHDILVKLNKGESLEGSSQAN